MKNLTDTLTKIIEEQLSIDIPNDCLDYESDFSNDLNADSLDYLEMALKLEEELNIKLSQTDINEMFGGSINDALIFLEKMNKDFE